MTSLKRIVTSPAGRARLKALIQSPRLKPRPTVLVPSDPQGMHPSLMGTAIDLAIRFSLSARGWYRAQDSLMADECLAALAEINAPAHIEASARARSEEARALVQVFSPDDALSDAAARGCLLLASLESVSRGGEEALRALDAEPSLAAVAELQALFALVPWSRLRPERWGVLNPTFGVGSHLVGGADADIALDDMLIEIKAVKEQAIDLDHIRQLVGYAVLAERFGIDDHGPVQIDRLAIYFARAGHLFEFPLSAAVADANRTVVCDELLDLAAAVRQG